jgi:hypothetical protein
MSVSVELYVRRKGEDAEAITALAAGRKLPGVGADLVELGRETRWILTFEGDDRTGAEAETRRVAEETTVLFNPNQDRAEYGASHYRERFEDGTWAQVTVWERERDGREDGVLATLRELYGVSRLADVRRHRIWTARLAVPSTAAGRQVGACLAFREDRGRGLLANPHSDRFEVTAGKGGAPLG